MNFSMKSNRMKVIAIAFFLFGACFLACSPAKEPETGTAVSPPLVIVCPEGKVLEKMDCVDAPCPGGTVRKEGKCTNEPALLNPPQ